MGKRFLSILLTLVMVIGMLPTVAFAAEGDPEIWVGGVGLASGQYLDEDGNVGTEELTDNYAYYEDGDLTLKNFDYSGDGHAYATDGSGVVTYSALIYADGDIYVNLIGDSTLADVDTPNVSVSAIYSNGTIAFLVGTGSLTATVNGDGICTNDTLAVFNATLTLNAGGYGIMANNSASNNDYVSFTNSTATINAVNGAIFTNGNVDIINNSSVTMKSTGSGDGIRTTTGYVAISGNSTVKIDAAGYGIYSNCGDEHKYIQLKDSAVDITAVKDGIRTPVDIHITNVTGKIVSTTDTSEDDLDYCALNGKQVNLNSNMIVTASLKPNGSDPEKYSASYNGLYDWITFAEAPPAAVENYIYLAGVKLEVGKYLQEDGTLTDVKPDDDYAYLTSDTSGEVVQYSLTLHNFDFTGLGSWGKDAYNALYYHSYGDHLELILEGTNNLKEPDSSFEDTCGIFIGRVNKGSKMLISGEGTLNIEADTGIFAYNGAQFEIESGNVSIAAEGNGISMDGAGTVSGGTVNINAGETGVYFEDDVRLTVSDGTLNISGGTNGVYSGLYGAGFRIDGGNVTVKSLNTANDDNYYAVKMSYFEYDSTFGFDSSLPAQASTEPDGSNPETYNRDKNSTYDWIKIGSAPAPTKYNVWVAGTQVTSANAADVLGDGAASYNPTTNTLTVSKNITATDDVIYATTAGNFNVVIADGVTLSASGNDGIYYDGDGTLTVSGGNITINAYEDAIEASGNIKVTGSALNISAKYGVYSEEGSVELVIADISIDTEDHGVFGYGDVTISGKNLSVDSNNNKGIYAYDGDVTINSEKIEINADEDGIYAAGDIKITGSALDITAYYGMYSEYKSIELKVKDISIDTAGLGIIADENITISSENLFVDSSNNVDIYANNGDVTISGGEIEINAGEDGIGAYGNIKITGSALDIDSYYGVYSETGFVELKVKEISVDTTSLGIAGNKDVTISSEKLSVDSSNAYGIKATNGDVTISGGETEIIAREDGIVAYGDIILEKGTFDIQSTDVSEDEADYYALYFTDGVQFPTGATVTAATEPNGTFVSYVEADNDTYDHVKIGVVEEVTPITTVEIDGVSAPQLNQTGEAFWNKYNTELTDGTITLNEKTYVDGKFDNIIVVDGEFYHADKETDVDDSHVIAPGTYYNALALFPAEGFEFAEDITATVDGATATETEFLENGVLVIYAKYVLEAPAPAPTMYPVWVAGTQVTSDNAGNILGNGEASYNAETNTLTVSDDITATGNDHVIKAETTADFKVEITNDVTLSAEDGAGIYATNNIIINCGKLNITTKSNGIYSENGSVSITGDEISCDTKYASIVAAGVTINSDKFSIASKDSDGILSTGDVDITGGENSEITINACFDGIDARGDAKVTIECGKLNITGNYGIYASNGNVELTAEDVTIEADSNAIYCDKDITIGCETLDITAEINGIYSENGSVSITGDEISCDAKYASIIAVGVTINCDKLSVSSEESDGILSTGDVSITGGENSEITISAGYDGIDTRENAKVTIECGKLDITGYYGITTGSGDINISKGDVKIVAIGHGIVAYSASINIGGTLDVQSTSTEYDSDCSALYFGKDFTYPTGATVIAATEPNGTFVPYVEADNATYDHVKISNPASTGGSSGGSSDDDTPSSGGNTVVDKPTDSTFEDVAEDTYYNDAVEWAVENDITTGTTDTTFSPDMICTRAQAVTFMWRAAGSPAPTNKEMIFTDVPENAYYYDAVLWAVENGITTGTNDGTTFSPDMNCSRGQIVTMLWRANGAAVADEDNPFADVSENAYYYNAVLWAVENNITTGTSGTSFSPDMACSRAQIVTFLYRGLNK